MSAMLHPVFWDPTGKRPYRVAFGVVLLALAVISGGLYCWRSVFTPVHEPLTNGSTGYPSAVLAGQDTRHMPIIGNTDTGILNRVVKVERRTEGVFLVDPYSNTVVRQANDLDLEQIQDKSLAIDYYGNSPPSGQLMLTFDDGPDARYTPEILDILAREGVPATFFVLGESVAKNSAVMQRIIREGHMVGNHTLTHRKFDGEWDLRNRAELLLTSRLIRATAGYETSLFRIPNADPDNNALALLHAQQQGMVHVNLDVDTLDWSYAAGEDVPAPVLDGEGHVVLMHDAGGDRAATIEMLENLIRTAKDQGYTFSTVAPLLPEQYIPQKGIDAGWPDHVTLWAFQSVWVVPGVILTALFWSGMGSLTIMTVVYLLLALIFQWRRRSVSWAWVTTDMLPHVTVVLAAYNEAAVIERTLDALRRTNYPSGKFEVIVVDDGSLDETLQIIRNYAARWAQLKVLTQPNRGKAAALNAGIDAAAAQSAVIVTLDADTVFLPSTVYRLARHFVEGAYSGPMGVVAGHVKVGNRRNLLTAWQSLEYISGITVTRTAEGLMGAISIVPGACSAWSRKGLELVGGFSSVTLAEDADVTLALQKLRYKVMQENGAVAYTEAPETIRTLAKQRKRWMFGVIQVLWKHRRMMLNGRYGALGLVSLPYAALSLLVPLLFMPLTVIVAVMNLLDGNWQSVALFAAFVAGMHMIVSIVAIAMADEKPWHLLVVPIYRLIYEPLRAYLLYASVYRVISGRVVEWNKLERTNNVAVQYASQ